MRGVAANPTNIILGSALLVQSDNTRVTRVNVRNAWDNGIALASITSTGGQTNGSPIGVAVSDCQTFHCGLGVAKGAGVNVATASRVTVAGCIDTASYQGFIVDFAGGGSGAFSGCIAMASRLAAGVTGRANQDGSGVGYWIGGTDVIVSGCYALFCAADGFFFDGYSANVTVTGCEAGVCGWNGYYIWGDKISLVNCVARNNSRAGHAAWDGIFVDGSTRSLATTLVNCLSTSDSSPRQRYGYGETAGDGHVVHTRMLGGFYDGNELGQFRFFATAGQAVSYSRRHHVSEPGGRLTAPAVTTSAVQNSFGVPVNVYIAGAVSRVVWYPFHGGEGHTLYGAAANVMVHLEPGEYIQIGYSRRPTWEWIGE
jgi:hypothetical protein